MRRIAVLTGQDLGLGDVIRGIHAYAMQKSGWLFRSCPAELQMIPYLRDWRPHGIIAVLFTLEMARQVMKLRKPVVDIASMIEGLKAPTVDVDHAAAGRLAAEHFLERGFKHFGYFGSEAGWYSKLREKGYRERLAEARCTVSSCYAEYIYLMPAMTDWIIIEQRMRQWLMHLPKPAAVFVANDVPARSLTDICRQLGLNVPGQISILGVDNNELECLLAFPPLSSIAIPNERVGYEAAHLLDRMMSGEDVPRGPIFLPPVRVVIRQSTDTLAVDDPTVASALAFIRQHAKEGIHVATIVAEAGVVRRELERKFRALLGCSILKELQRVRVELAKELLTDTQLSMPAVARQSGFSNAKRLATVFRQVTSISPSAFRRRARVKS